jgi:hypothetical protein
MKDLATMTNSAINRRLDSLSNQLSKVNQKFIDSGRGHERPSDFRHQTDALAKKYIKLSDEYSALANEVGRRYGPGAPSRLPRQTRSRRRNPSPFATVDHDLIGAQEAVARARRDWCEMERQARTYYDGDEIMFSASFRNAYRKAREKLDKAERALKMATKKKTTRRKNPAYGNYAKARSVARGSRKVNPAKASGPGYKGFVVAAFKPGTQTVEYWDGQKFGTHAKAATYSTQKIAAYVAGKCTRFNCAVAGVNTAGANIRLAMLGQKVPKGKPFKFSPGFRR